LTSLFRRSLTRMLGRINRTGLGARVNQVLARGMMDTRVTVEHRGTRLSFVAPNHVNAWRAASFATKEPETLEWIDGFEDGSVLWDIGANVGLYSCYAAAHRRCRVFAFEPSVFNLELLARNVWANDLSGRVTLVSLPLSDKVAESTLNMTTTEWGGAMSTFGESYTHDGTALDKVFEFRTVGVSMDAAVSQLQIPQPDYIKMDVDGIEHLILAGGATVLRAVRGVLVEINEDFALQATNSAAALSAAGLTMVAKRHSEMFEGTQFRNCFNQIWRREALTR
jgi:FkbM family methyltransferase